MADGSNGGGWGREPVRDAIQGFLDREVPENCVLVAYDTGDGWYLGVRNGKGKEIAMLAWPESWPESMSPAQLKEFGFKVI